MSDREDERHEVETFSKLLRCVVDATTAHDRAVLLSLQSGASAKKAASKTAAAEGQASLDLRISIGGQSFDPCNLFPDDAHLFSADVPQHRIALTVRLVVLQIAMEAAALRSLNEAAHELRRNMSFVFASYGAQRLYERELTNNSGSAPVGGPEKLINKDDMMGRRARLRDLLSVATAASTGDRRSDSNAVLETLGRLRSEQQGASEKGAADSGVGEIQAKKSELDGGDAVRRPPQATRENTVALLPCCATRIGGWVGSLFDARRTADGISSVEFPVLCVEFDESGRVRPNGVRLDESASACEGLARTAKTASYEGEIWSMPLLNKGD